MNTGKLEHGPRRIGARIPYKLYLEGMSHEDIDVPAFWLLLLGFGVRGLGIFAYRGNMVQI